MCKHIKILPEFLIERLVTRNVRPKTTIFIFRLNQNHLHGTRLEVCVAWVINNCISFTIRLSVKQGTGNRGTERGTEQGTRKPGTRKAGICKTRNMKSRNL